MTSEIKKPKILIPEIKLQNRVKELGQQISYDYQDVELTAVCVLKGSFIFYSDLIRNIEIPINCEFLGLSSYGNEIRSSGEVKVTLDLNEPLEGKHVLLVEDIVDTGLTLKFMLNSLRSRNPASIKTCALLQKPDSLKTDVEVDYVGFKIQDDFVVGYGIDYAQKLRGLPYIGYVENEH